MISEIALICVPQPIPNEASMASSANSTPSHFMFSPRSSAYIAPPCMRPSLVCTRYLTAIRLSAYLVAMPNTPVSQHHSTAPGPPRNTAVPTPTILPVPMVDASAVVSAWNWLTSPGESGSFVTDSRIPVNVLRWIKPVRTVMNRCVPISITIIGRPQIQLSIAVTILENVSMILPLPLFNEFQMQKGSEAMASLPFQTRYPPVSSASGSRRQPARPCADPAIWVYYTRNPVKKQEKITIFIVSRIPAKGNRQPAEG